MKKIRDFIADLTVEEAVAILLCLGFLTLSVVAIIEMLIEKGLIKGFFVLLSLVVGTAVICLGATVIWEKIKDIKPFKWLKK